MKSNTDMNRLYFERKLWSEGFSRIMGLDEVGRGCLAGPVVAAGVILSPEFDIKEIRDSKTLDEPMRRELAEWIREKSEFWIIRECSVEEIKQLNILWASVRAMQKCAEDKDATPEYLLVDGNQYGSSLIPYTCLTKGDDRSASIAAASIIAKEHRDQLMRKLHTEFPEFGWNSNVGYPTKKHREALKKNGYTVHHRTGFNLGTAKRYSG